MRVGVRRHLKGVEPGAPAGPLQGADLVVFDLDGTLVRLNVDWKSLRRELGEIASRAGMRTTDPRALRSKGKSHRYSTFGLWARRGRCCLFRAVCVCSGNNLPIALFSEPKTVPGRNSPKTGSGQRC